MNDLASLTGPMPAAQQQNAAGQAKMFWSAALVFALYLAVHLFVFRAIVVALPDLMAGRSVVNTSELVPFFSPGNQLLEQAGGAFSDLTNEYEFRVRYSILTTWMRYYLILPFALILIPMLGAFMAALAITSFLRSLYPSIPPRRILFATALTTLLIHLLLLPAKFTHFYTLILGFDFFVVSLMLLLKGLLFEQKRPLFVLATANLLALVNPAVHFLVLYPITVVFLCVGLCLLLLIAREGKTAHRLWKRIFIALSLMLLLTIIPYGLFVKFYVLKGIGNLTDVIPDTVQSIRASSLPLLHQITFDIASATDSYLTGRYIPLVPRFGKAFYFLLALLPFVVPVTAARAERRRARPFLLLIGCLMLFAMWCSVGYADILFIPTFHGMLAMAFNRLYVSSAPLASVSMQVIVAVIHVLRAPDRFQFIFLLTMCLLMPVGLLATLQCVERLLPHRNRPVRLVTAMLCSALFFLPLLAHREYRTALLSGDFGGFLRPYNVRNLREIKEALHALPQGKTVVLPASESAWIGTSGGGTDYRFIDKFFIYYLDVPSFYFGLSGSLENKVSFYLLYRALANYDVGWVDIARNLRIRYIVVNKELSAPPQSPWYVRGITRAINEQPKMLTHSLHKIKENAGFTLYELIDPQPEDAPSLLLATDWKRYQCVQEQDPTLAKQYHTLTLGEEESPNAGELTILADDSESVRLDLFARAHPERFFRPDQSSFAFNADHLPSAQLFGTVFPMLNTLTNSSYNLLRIVMPGPFSTLTDTFVGLLKPTTIRFPITVPAPRTYEILLRGIGTAHALATHVDAGPVLWSIVQPNDVPTQFVTAESVPFGVRAPFDLSHSDADTLSNLIPKKIMPVGDRFHYMRLGTFDLQKGSHMLFLQKQDGNPLVAEGVLLFPVQKFDTETLVDPGTRFLSPSRLAPSHDDR